MEQTKRRQLLEAEYDQPVDELLAHKYEVEGLSQTELADELTNALPEGQSLPRSTLQYWLREAGVEMRSRTLSDVQRIGIAILLPHLSDRSIAERVGCATVTVRRYRREVTRTESPPSVDIQLTDADRDLLVPDSASQWVANDTTDTTSTTDTADASQ